ncbi:signal transduction histidine kinase [Mycena filopes]|nr:signal transduction histidine kinase [Mycena filopes]
MAPGDAAAAAADSAGGTIDLAAFTQIIELDDDDDTYAYSKDMISMYFTQAPKTFAEMDAALAATDLRTLADLAHFLMGSSATLGIARVAATCARMEGVGEASLAAADKDAESGGALKQIGTLLTAVKREYADAETWLRRWYADHGQAFEPPPPPPETEAEAAQEVPKSDAEVERDVGAPPQPPPQTQNAATTLPPLKDTPESIPSTPAA